MQWTPNGNHVVSPDSGSYALYSRVKLSGTYGALTPPTVTTAGVEDDFGVLMSVDPFGTASTPQTVRTANAEGTVPMIAAGAISAGATVYPAAGGKITATVQGNAIGKALQAASGNNSVIEVFRQRAPVPLALPAITRNLLAASVDEYIYIAPFAMTVTAIKALIAVAGSDGSAVSLDVRKITSAGTALPGAGAGATVKELLASAIDLKSTAGTTVVGSLTATAADLILAAGDKLAINFTGTLTSLVGLLSIEAQTA